MIVILSCIPWIYGEEVTWLIDGLYVKKPKQLTHIHNETDRKKSG